MKNILAILIFSISLAAFATGGDMGGGRSMAKDGDGSGGKVISISSDQIEAVISKDGVYARPIDLQEGFEKFEGVKVTTKKIILDLSTPAKLDVGTILLRDGRAINMDAFKAVSSGGDMGGG